MRRTLIFSLLGLFSLSLVGGCGDTTPPPSASPAVAPPTVDAPQGKGGRFGKPAIKSGTTSKKTTES